MTTIKKITTRTIFLVTAIVGFSFISSLLGKLFFSGAEVNLTKLESAVNDTKNSGGHIIPVVSADAPPPPGGGGSGGGDGGGSGDGSGDY
ncbi:MAG: hypothetical protein WC848_00015 [Parcubacteria group bacterium]|jgi:hypothetical protein